MTATWKTITTLALAVALAVPAVASQSKPADPKAAPTVVGQWSASLETPHGKMPVTFELKLDAKDGKTITGTFATEQTGPLPLKGQYVDGKLTYSVSAGQGDLEFNGKMKDRDAITGILTSHVGDLVVNATRVTPEKLHHEEMKK